MNRRHKLAIRSRYMVEASGASEYGCGVDRGLFDLWIVRLDERGRCTAFEEWAFWPPGTEGRYSPDPS
jgi:hypothetical protein